MKTGVKTELVRKPSKNTWTFQRENILTSDESCRFRTSSRDSGIYFKENELGEIVDIAMNTLRKIGLL